MPGVVGAYWQGMGNERRSWMHEPAGRSVTSNLDALLLENEALRQQVTVDPHSPAQYRAAVPPRNIDAWYAAFGVQPGDEQYLAPEARARIW